MTQRSTNPKDRIGMKKPPLHLIPSTAMIWESMAFRDGAKKYGPYNWRDESVSASVYVAACKRHLEAWFDHEENAPDSGVHHLAHSRACLAILLDAQWNGTLVDDRPTAGNATELIEMLTTHDPAMDAAVRHEVADTATLVETMNRWGSLEWDNHAPTWYVSGGMRGHHRWNFIAFDASRDKGTSLGLNIISPADIDRSIWGMDPLESPEARIACEKIVDNWGEEELLDCVMRDAAAILSLRRSKGDGIALLPGWEKSTGAVAEFFLARFANLNVADARTFKPITGEEIDKIDFDAIAVAARRYLEGQLDEGTA